MVFRFNIPPTTRAFLISLLALSFLYNVARWRQIGSDSPDSTIPYPNPRVPYLTLIPASFIYYPWTFFTATFVEQNVFTVLLNSATLLYGGKYLERAWGSSELGKFILIISVIPNLVIVPVYILWAAVTGNSGRGLTQICGGISTQASFLVAFKQLVPEHTVTVFKGLIKMRVKHFPFLFLLSNTLSGIIFGTDTAAVLSWLGLLTSWSYLRFYKRQPDLTGTSTDGLGVKGDASETFSFACLFPDMIQPVVVLVADNIFSILVMLKICTPFSAEDVASGNEQVLARGEAGLPSLLTRTNSNRGGGSRGMAKREEAERRRAIALRALDQRLQVAAAARAQAQPPSQPQQPTISTSLQTNTAATAAVATTTASPTIATGQSMLGETNYTPDNN